MTSVKHSVSVRLFNMGQDIMGRAKPSGASLVGYTDRTEACPLINPHHQFYPSGNFLDLIMWFTDKEAEPLYIFGPSGVGKTSSVKQMAARINYPVYEVTGHSRLEFPELIGQWKINNSGSMTFEYGPLAQAMKTGGIFLLNEIDLLDPATAAGLNSILDGSSLCIPENGGEIIAQDSMFRFVATANTRGSLDDTGVYHGTLRQNLALLDRFLFSEAVYPGPEDEYKILSAKYPDDKIPEEIKKKMIALAGDVRESFQKGSLSLTMTTRALLRWCGLLVKCRMFGVQDDISPVSYSFQRALAFRGDPDTSVFLNEMLQRHFGSD